MVVSLVLKAYWEFLSKMTKISCSVSLLIYFKMTALLEYYTFYLLYIAYCTRVFSFNCENVVRVRTVAKLIKSNLS